MSVLCSVIEHSARPHRAMPSSGSLVSELDHSISLHGAVQVRLGAGDLDLPLTRRQVCTCAVIVLDLIQDEVDRGGTLQRDMHPCP